MANKSILDVDLIETTVEEDSFYVNSGQSLRQVKKKNVKFDYNTHVENKPSINDVELTGNKTLDELGIGSAAEVTSLNGKFETNKQDIADLRQSKADVMVHTAKGSHITVNNSADAFFEGLKIYGKSEQVQTKGVNLLNNDHFSEIMDVGAAPNFDPIELSGSEKFVSISFDIEQAGRYVLSCDDKYSFSVNRFYTQDKGVTPIVDGKVPYTFEATKPGKVALSIERDVSSSDNTDIPIGKRMVPSKFKFMVNSGAQAQPYEPFTGGKPSPSVDYPQEIESTGDSGKIEVGVRGSNLYPKGDISTDNLNYKYTGIIPWTGKQNILLNFSAKTNVENGQLFIGAFYYDKDKKELGGNGTARPCGTTFKQYHNVGFSGIGAASGANVDLRNVRYIELHFGIRDNTATHIDYKDIVIADSEGVEFDGYQPPQTLSIPTPNGLPGIKVTSGGNYTDSNGQQWICDEMDFKRGKYVQRINKAVLDGSDDENWSEFTGVNLTKTKRFASAPYAIPAVDKSLIDSCITNRFLYLRNDSDKEHFRLSTSNGVFNQVVLFTNVDTVSDVNALKNWLKANPVEILVPLAAPIETDIPEETMNVYRKLYTNYPSTVIQNDSGAGMEVVYSTYSKRANKDDIFNLERTIEDKFTSIVTGSDIVADGTAQGSAIIKNIPGATKQDQTKGYQLFDASKIPTKSIGGATITNNGDGSFTISGSGNLTSGFDSFYQLTDREEIKRMFKVGKIYLKNNGVTFPYFHAYFQSTDGSRALTITDGKEHDLTEDILNNAAIVGFSVYANSGVTITPGTIRPMLYQSGDGTWESFTGGKPSPSAEYPQEITAIGEDKNDGYTVNITTHGNQLFDASKIQTKSAGGATVTNNGDGSFTISGSGNLTDYFGVNYQITDKKEIKKLFKTGKLYLKNSNTVPYFHIYFVDNNDSRTIELRDGEATITEDILNNVARVVFSIYGDNKKAIVPGTVKPMVYQDGYGSWEPFKLTTSDIPLDQPLYEGDRIYLEDGELWEYRENAKVVFDGSEDEGWNEFPGTSFNTVKMFASGGNIISIAGNSLNADHKSDKFYYIQNDSDKEHFRFSSTGGGNFNQVVIFAGIDYAKDLSTFKTWLQSNPIEVVYKLATPTRKKLGSAEAFGIRTFDECTHIKVANSEELGTENAFIVPKNRTGGVVTDAFATAKRNEIQLEAQQSKTYVIEQRTKNEFATMLSLMPLEIQAAMIENDTSKILESLNEVTK